MIDLGHTALGAWSGGRFLHFGEPIERERLAALLRPGPDIHTVLTADAYGAGEADRVVGAALEGLARDSYALIGSVGHDFYIGERAGAKGYPRFTDPALRGASEYGDYLRMAAERSLERCGVDHFDLLMLHNPDRTGYTSAAVWDGMASLREAGLTRALGIAPGPANGYTLDLVACLERYGSEIDWAMLILSPLEPWPAELALGAAQAAGTRVIARVVDYGGLFWDDVAPGHAFAEHDHRLFRPKGWIEAGITRLAALRPIAARHHLTLLQLAAQWDLAHAPVACVVPTLIQEPGPDARPIEAKRAELAAVPADGMLSDDEIEEIRRIGDNTGTMLLKGAHPDYEGDPVADRWPLEPRLTEAGARFGISPDRDLRAA